VMFTDHTMIQSIRNNKTVRIRAILHNDDGAVMFEIPSCTLGGGDKSFTLNETVKLSLDAMAFKDDTYGDSINIMVFPYIPDVAKSGK